MSNRIKESNITPGAVTSDKIAPGTISASNITPGTITTTQIAPGTIANDRLANTGITINGTTIALGASGTIVAGTDWQSVVTADGSTATTASAGEGYFIDTTSNAHTINLPSSPTQGDEVHIVDYAGTFGSNNVTVGRNGSNIDGTASDGTLATNRLNVRFVYIDATKGWRAIFDDASENYGAQYIAATGGTLTTSGDFKIHTFTGDGCFVVSSVGNPAGSDSVDYLVIAGGGGGGNSNGGGGGAGGMRLGAVSCIPAPVSPYTAPGGLPVSATTYPVTVGGGGAGQPAPSTSCSGATGTSGSNSVFSTITSTGGGGGGSGLNAGPGINAQTGGSGGGGGTNNGCGGAGNTPPVSPSQGNNGGDGGGPGSGVPYQTGGGGGGHSAVGASATPSPVAACDGGDGNTVEGIFGAAPQPFYTAPGPQNGYFAGGGGGGSSAPVASNSSGGLGGGGAGSISGVGGGGTANTGSGGGGGAGGPQAGGAGGKGYVLIRYKFQN